MLDIKSTPHMPKDGGFLEDYTWIRLLKKEKTIAKTPQPALFLDRDGVINVEKSFIIHPDMFELEDGIIELIRFYNQKDWPVIVVTNQSGIAKEKMSWNDYWLIEDRMIQDLAANGAFVDLILACPCHPEGIAPYNEIQPPSRKPAPGMLKSAIEILAIDIKSSIIIGDRIRDIEAGRNTGLRLGILRDSGHHESQQEWQIAQKNQWDNFELFTIKDVSEALPIIKIKIKELDRD
ncbi:MAG: HAD-IIIA family hydrolase [Alphaproteobacteria bacterium]